MVHSDLVLHKTVSSSLSKLVHRPTHAVLLVGPAGSGKKAIANTLASQLLGITVESLETYPYSKYIQPIDHKAISIESIRELQHFLSLKIPGKSPIARIVIIADAHLLTTEAQNALLKTLEEPPSDTVLVLTAENIDSLLPTIQSRVRAIPIASPPAEDLKKHFASQGLQTTDIEKALMLGAGMPGLANALLTNKEGHVLYDATIQARALLQASTYERLLHIEALSKQKQQCQYIVFILGEMAHTALLRSSAPSSKAAERWKQIMHASYQAQQQLKTNTQTKLVLTNLMLAL